jgi:hypothetical protein
MFDAGAIQAKAEFRHRWAWPAIAVTLAVVAVSESAVLAVRPTARVIVVQRRAPAPETRHEEPEPVQILSQSSPSRSEADDLWSPGGSGEALALRRQVLRFGLDGLPDPPAVLSQAESPAPGTPSSLRRYEFDKVMKLGGPS